MAHGYKIFSSLPKEDLQRVMSEILEAWPRLNEIFVFDIDDIRHDDDEDEDGFVWVKTREEGFLDKPRSSWTIWERKGFLDADQERVVFCDLIYHILGRHFCHISDFIHESAMGYGGTTAWEASVGEVVQNYLTARGIDQKNNSKKAT